MNRLLITISLLFIASCSGSTSVDSPADPSENEESVLIPDPETVGGLDVEWEVFQILSKDPANDQLGDGPDLGDLRAFYDDDFLYIQVQIIKGGDVKQFDIAVLDAEERLMWVSYYPEDSRVEVIVPRLGRVQIDAETYYGHTLELIIPMNSFALSSILDQPIREVNIVRAMTGALSASDEVSGGVIPNQFGELEFARRIDPYEILKATMEAQYETSGAGQYENLDASDLFNHESALRIMSYNIQFGGIGLFNDGGTLESGRLPIITEIITKNNPDIIAFQELNGWNLGSPTLAQQFAEKFEMDYVYCKSAESEFDTAIFSKYEIVEQDVFPNVAFCFLHIGFRAPSGETIHVFANHGYFDDELGCNEPLMREMIAIAAPYTDGLAIFMGDLNIANMVGFTENAIPEEVCYQLLFDAGWVIAAYQNIDQIYVSNSLLNFTGYPLNTQDNETLDVPSSGVGSDHAPLVWDLYLQ